jgi:phage-related protein
MGTSVMVFSIIAALALVLQVAILVALFIEIRETNKRLNSFVDDLHVRMGPILTRVQMLLEDTQPKISNMVSDAAHVVYLTRGQAQKMDRVLTDASDRLHGQLNHIDRVLTAALETVEEAGSQFRQSVWRPMQKASALVQGIKVGLDLLRSRRGNRHGHGDEPREQTEEELFI